jgi:prevent-host-death family protein
MATVSIRELGRNASSVVKETRDRNMPTLVTNRGTLVAALIPIAENEVEEYILARYLSENGILDEAEREIADGDVLSAEQAAAELDAE